MNIKEQIIKILGRGMEGEFTPSEDADQILDLVLNALTIEKTEHVETECTDEKCIVKQRIIGRNMCIDAYEKLKNKLRN